jgi:hypothetical protein
LRHSIISGDEGYFNSLNVSLMLLGPGECIRYREQVRIELIEMGFKRVILMEEEIDKLKDISLDDKFHRIIDEKDPSMFIAFFHNGVRMEGVTFELGWLCCKYHATALNQKLKILTEKNYDVSKTTPYISSILQRVLKSEFDESKIYSKASERISKWALDLVLTH